MHRYIYKLRTLLIVLALGPPVLAWTWSVLQAHYMDPDWNEALRLADAVAPEGGGFIAQDTLSP